SVASGSNAYISLPSGTSITLAKLTGGSYKGSLTFNGYTLAGVAASGPVGSDTTAKSVASGETVLLTANDLVGAFGRGMAGSLTATGAATVAGGDAITITSAGSNTITATSQMYSNN
ncbi:MAG: hypothetical protein LBP42_06505, partial [Treponema sp.]|nr:hypothetical protein [Treponema sp.]